MSVSLLQCVVPENIHTPTTEGIGNSRGVGGSMAQEIPEGRGGEWLDKFPRANFTFMSDINVQNCNLPTLQLRKSFLKTLLCLTVLKKPLLH